MKRLILSAECVTSEKVEVCLLKGKEIHDLCFRRVNTKNKNALNLKQQQI